MKYAVVQVFDSVGGVETGLVACADTREVQAAINCREPGFQDWSVHELVNGRFQRRSVVFNKDNTITVQ